MNIILNDATIELTTLATLLINTILALILGFFSARLYLYKNKHSQTLALMLVILPALVAVVIKLVSGNIGAGLAVAGAFSLIRFRSVPGNGRDIAHLFFSMVLGFIIGMEFWLEAVIFCLVIGLGFGILIHFNFGGSVRDTQRLKITIPENLDYEQLFDEVFENYAEMVELERVKTVHMGSLYELTYELRLKQAVDLKEFLDELRCRNGNLTVLISREQVGREEL